MPQTTWEVLVTQVYEDWFLGLTEAEQVDVLAMVNVLEIRGPHLGRPYVDSLKGTRKVSHLKELRVQHAGKPYRVFFAFDPVRRAVLLCGGRKDGKKEKQFYDRMIPIAEREFLDHLYQEGLD